MISIMFSFSNLKPSKFHPGESFPLIHACKNKPHQIMAIHGNKGMMQKLMELGLPMGAKIEILQHQAGGGIVVAKGNLRIALGPAIANQVLVHPL